MQRSWPSSKFLGYQVLTHRCVLSLCVAVAGGGGVGEYCFWAHYNISILTYLLTYLPINRLKDVLSGKSRRKLSEAEAEAGTYTDVNHNKSVVCVGDANTRWYSTNDSLFFLSSFMFHFSTKICAHFSSLETSTIELKL